MRRMSRKAFLRGLDPDTRRAIKTTEKATGNTLRVWEKPDGDVVLDYTTPKKTVAVARDI